MTWRSTRPGSVARRRIKESIEGFSELMRCWPRRATCGGTDPRRDRDPPGPAGRRAARRRRAVYAINPMAVARYRERYSPAAKSDHADAMVLAAILRTDADVHRPLPADTELARSVAVLARAAQDAAWRRTAPAGTALPAAGVLPRHDGGRRPPSGNLATPTPATVRIAPAPAAAAKLTAARIAAALRRAWPRARDRAARRRAPQDLRRPGCARTRSSSTPWAPRRCACWPRWTPSAPASRSWAGPARKPSASTPTMP